jgi:hypothetical protein
MSNDAIEGLSGKMPDSFYYIADGTAEWLIGLWH